MNQCRTEQHYKRHEIAKCNCSVLELQCVLISGWQAYLGPKDAVELLAPFVSYSGVYGFKSRLRDLLSEITFLAFLVPNLFSFVYFYII
jgi:hypothetical protein